MATLNIKNLPDPLYAKLKARAKRERRSVAQEVIRLLSATLDTPPALKASVPGSNVIEAQFENAPADWEQQLHKLTSVTSVQHEGAGMYRILTGDGSQTTTELVESAVRANVGVKSLSVQNTTLDDVFVHYTGRQLRDELQKAYAFVMPPRPGMQP